MKTKQVLMVWAGVMVMALAVWPVGRLFAAGTESPVSPDVHVQAMEESEYEHGSGHESMYRHERSDDGGAADSGAEFSGSYLKKQLGLTDDQAAKLRALHTQTMKETILQGAKLKVAALELHDLLRNGKPDAPAIEKKVKEIEALRSDLTLTRTRALLKAEEFLKPEQFDRFRAIMLQRMESWAARSPYGTPYGEMHDRMRTSQRGERDCPSHGRRPA